MKTFLTTLYGVLMTIVACAQPRLPFGLKETFESTRDDSSRFISSRPVYTFYEETNRDSALHYARFRYELARKNGRKIEEAHTQGQMAYQQIYLGQFSEALKNLTAAFQVLADAKEAPVWELTPFSTPGSNRLVTLSMLNHMFGHLKLRSGNPESIYYFKEGRRIGLEIGNAFRVTVADMVLGSTYLTMNLPDSALIFAIEGETFAKKGGITKYLANIYYVMAEVNRLKGNDSLALKYFDASLNYAVSEENITVVASSYEGKIKYYLSRMKPDSVIFYGRKQLTVLRSLGAITALFSSENNLGNAYKSLATAFDLKKQTDSANKYLHMALQVNDSLTEVKQNRLVEFQRLTLDEQIRVQAQERDRLAAENNRKILLLFAGIAAALMIIALIYRNNRQKQKAYDQLQVQKEKTDAALQELKSTQAQLIQAEKMASLGELTAGIAHEIQNPLNFVNNFSEINAELSEEILEAAEKGDIDEVKALATDIKSNQEKIREHGKRADSIVKGMLQHSRSSAGSKEPTNIAALADEYLRLAYHGMRAKDKSFNASLNTEFDPQLPLVPVVAQDIGRVLLNLFNNAFYAVNERKKTAGDGYEPEVVVKCRRADSPTDNPAVAGLRYTQPKTAIQISVHDNGPGIPDSIKEKIFQPFFTTKPTGQGTGLGLSLSYDIIKAHGGEFEVHIKEGEGTAFIIHLPI